MVNEMLIFAMRSPEKKWNCSLHIDWCCKVNNIMGKWGQGKGETVRFVVILGLRLKRLIRN